ncbi:MAG: menaquinone biosynthesis protein [Deinococcus sp.]|nr:menaquinone biosynthesis protein [Deinococcus sp.]
MYTLGLPGYANTAPLQHFLEQDQRLRIRFGVPTELNRWLLNGEVDLSLVSSHFFLQHQDKLAALPDFSISVLGRVYSVNLFHRVPWNELARVALTTESATSVELLKHLARLDGLEPQYTAEQGGLELLENYHGVLLIGDRAIQSYASLLTEQDVLAHRLPTRFAGLCVTDLSMKWFERTKLPFVFALWATRRDEPPPEQVLNRLRAARVKGLGNLEAVARSESGRLGISYPLMQHYLANFRYFLDPSDREGLVAFARALNFQLDLK